MWARAVTTLLGLWMMISPAVIGYGYDGSLLMWNDLAGGAVAAFLSLLSCWGPARRAAFLILPLALWTGLYSYFGFEHPRPHAAQNAITVGILLMMFAIIPLRASEPPPRTAAPSRRPGRPLTHPSHRQVSGTT